MEQLAPDHFIADIVGMAIKRSASGKFQDTREGAQRRGESYRVAGETSDGVKILRSAVPPKHFTSKQIRQAITSVVGDRRKG